MFKTYEELLNKSFLSKVKDHGIGLGLSNSSIFAIKLGGSLRITNSNANGTNIIIEIPVEIKPNQRSSIGSVVIPISSFNQNTPPRQGNFVENVIIPT